jgi:hypothetical protein
MPSCVPAAAAAAADEIEKQRSKVWLGMLTQHVARSYQLYAASALAANSFARSSFAAAFPCVSLPISITPSPRDYVVKTRQDTFDKPR